MASNNTVVINISAKDDASRVILGLTSQLDNGLTKSLGRATLGANLMTSAITAGLQAVGNLASKSISLFNEAAKTQSSIISTAGNVMKLAGYNFKQATAFVEDFQTEMAKVAASLPGMASDFADFGRGIIDNVIPAFAGLDGKLDPIERKGALERVKELSTWGTLLSQSAGIDSTLGARQAGFFLSGSRTLQQLKGLNLYEQNITFTNELERLLNGRDVRKVSDEERQKIFLQAARLDPAVLDALSESVEGIFGLVNDKLFGLETGIFGFMRDLDSKTEGKQTALKSINKSLLALFGPDGLFDNLDISLKKLGISLGDPMLALSKAADGFTKIVKDVTEFLKDFNATNDLDYLKTNLSNLFNRIFNFDGLGDKLANLFNQGSDFLGKLDWATLFSGLGQKLAEILNEVFRFLLKLDYSKSLNVIQKVVDGLFIGLTKFITTIDWGAFALALGKALWEGVKGSTDLMVVLLTTPLINGFKQFGELLSRQWDKIWRATETVWNRFISSTTNFFQKITDWFNDLISKIPGFNAQANTGLTSGITNGLTQSVPNSAGGRVDGLLAAAIRETKAAPPASGLVVANTSEAILNRQQQLAVINSLGRRGGNLTIGSLIINTQATDPRGIAKDVMRFIAQEFNNYNQGYVTAPVV